MGKRSKNIITGMLTVAFLWASVFCCCLTQSAQAEEPAVSCHQTTPDTPQPQNHSDTDCDCDKPVSTLTAQSGSTFKFIVQDTFSIIQVPVDSFNQIFAVVTAYQAPPVDIAYTTPLYLKNSSLRL